MAIHFIPNDPAALKAMPLRRQKARPARPADRAGFALPDGPKQAVYAPMTADFLHWQCRESAHAAVAAWEACAGPLTAWAAEAVDSHRLPLTPDAGADLNAYYDRDLGLQFFHHHTATKDTLSGASAEVVAHEVGHALLDAIRPDLWTSSLFETNAFHEGFGDCIAILTVLADKATRTALLKKTSDLAKENFVEAFGEDLAAGIRDLAGPTHSAALPRRARNSLQWQLPTALPVDGPPGVLIAEEHAFGQLLSGCFYDTIRNLYLGQAKRTEAALWSAAKAAAKLLITGTKNAPATARFLQAVGRAMVLAGKGREQDAVRAAFAAHGIALGSAAMAAPRAVLAGGVPSFSRRGPRLAASTMRDLSGRLGASAPEHLSLSAVTLGSEQLTQVVHQREVSLARLGKRFAGVVAMAPESVLVRGAARSAALASALPDATATEDEVAIYVQSLAKHGRIAAATPARRRGAALAAAEPEAPRGTHRIVEAEGRKLLVRERFACGCCRRHFRSEG